MLLPQWSTLSHAFQHLNLETFMTRALPIHAFTLDPDLAEDTVRDQR